MNEFLRNMGTVRFQDALRTSLTQRSGRLIRVCEFYGSNLYCRQP
jgi:hypothetical protein